jgi:hypothetical protein
MKTTHTPGPWQILFNHIASESGRKIATIENRTLGEGFAESYENAFLISSAPDLLSALEEAYNAIAWLIPGGNLSDQEEEALLDTIRAAIAKAKGEA